MAEWQRRFGRVVSRRPGRRYEAVSAQSPGKLERHVPASGIIQETRSTGLETERQMASKTTNPFVFLQQVRQETAKVTWPSRRETMISTMMVLIFAVIAMLFFFTADVIMGNAVEWILGLSQTGLGQ
jgi:preprotein translocase subunit SecE